MKQVQKGFTLIELMIVVAIIGILAAIAIPQYQNYITRSKWQDLIVSVESLKLSIAECSQNNDGDFQKCDTFSGGELDAFGTTSAPVLHYNATVKNLTAASATSISMDLDSNGEPALGKCVVTLTGDNSSGQNILWTFSNSSGCNKNKTGVGGT